MVLALGGGGPDGGGGANSLIADHKSRFEIASNSP